MKPRPPIELPGEIQATFRKVMRLQTISVVFMLLCVVLVYFTLGQSQAMHAVFIEDILGCVPGISYLIVEKVRWRKPNERFPYGFHGAVSLASLASAAAIFALGAFVLIEALKTLVTRQHPTVGVVALFGHQVWLGWLALPVLAFTMAGEFTFGQIKKPYAAKLHDTALSSDSRMQRADWLSGASAMGGMIGIALGWWWADGAAAAIIGFEIVRDGISEVLAGMHDLMDEVPEKVEEEQGNWEERLRDRVAQLDWVDDVAVRLREEGNMITGEVFVVPNGDGIERRFDELQRIARDVDWRFYDLMLVPVERL